MFRHQSGNCKRSQGTSLHGGFWFRCYSPLVSLSTLGLLLALCSMTPPKTSIKSPPIGIGYVENSKVQIEKVINTLAHLKEKKRLLTEYGEVDMFTSLRPKIGKRFSDSGLEQRRKDILMECRSKIIPLSLAEIDTEIAHDRGKLDSLYKNL